MTTLVRDRVLELLETSDLVEPRDLARKVYDDLVDEDEVREALLEVLPQYVRVLLSQHRRDNRRDRSMLSPSSHRAHGRSDGSAVERSPSEVSTSQVRDGERSTNLSPRWQRAAQGFRERYYPGEWKFLGDCTLADVERLASDYRRRAAEQRHYADRFELVRSRMERDGATLVAELPEAWVVQVLHGDVPPTVEGEEVTA